VAYGEKVPYAVSDASDRAEEEKTKR